MAKFVGFLTTALMLAAFALPASAAKTISLSVTPTTLTAQTTTVSAKITNTGNSNANSFEVDWLTSPYFTVTGASASGTSGTCSSPGRRGAGYTSCVFLKQIPTKSFVTITLNVQVTNQCTAFSIDWYAYAWTGSPGDVSQSFALQGAPPITSSSPNCTISFVTPPADAFIGSTITGSRFNSAGAPVSVQLQRSGAAVPGTNVSVSASAACAISDSATTDASGIARFTTLASTASATTDCVLTASSAGYGSASSTTFKVVQAGQLGCAADNNTFAATGAGALVVNGTRLENVDDPSPTAVGDFAAPACVVVPYVVSTTCPAGVTGTACTDFIYDPLDQGTHMAFRFTFEWPIETIPEGGIDAIPETGQLFINGRPTPVDLNLCPNTVARYDVDGNFELVSDPAYTGPLPHPQDQDSVAPGTQAGCLIGRNVIQDGSGLKLIEDAWVQGDYTTIRR